MNGKYNPIADTIVGGGCIVGRNVQILGDPRSQLLEAISPLKRVIGYSDVSVTHMTPISEVGIQSKYYY